MQPSTVSWRTHVTCVDLSEGGVCRLSSCRAPLPPRRTAYCSDKHARAFENDHVWSAARRAARRRAKWACERCGFKPSVERKNPAAKLVYTRHELRLEVNHIQPLIGAYRGVTCLNHSTNLEVLCHRCHLDATSMQRLGRAATAAAEAQALAEAALALTAQAAEVEVLLKEGVPDKAQRTTKRPSAKRSSARLPRRPSTNIVIP